MRNTYNNDPRGSKIVSRNVLLILGCQLALGGCSAFTRNSSQPVQLAPADEKKPVIPPQQAKTEQHIGASEKVETKNQPISNENSPDPIFAALEDEIQRARNLSMGQLDKPYWIGAFVQDVDSFDVAASFGALLARQSGKQSSIDSQIRVGDFNLDNTNFSDDGLLFSGGSTASSIPAEPDYDALRHALWLQLDDRYKKAVEAISKKRAFLDSNEAANRPADFSRAPVTSLIMPRKTLSIDREKWTQIAKRASAVFRGHAQVYASRVQLHASVAHQYFVSTEQVRHRFGETIFRFQIQATSQASDGMNLLASLDRWGRTESDLPSEAELVNAAESVAKRIEALSKAPIASEDYSGPVIFTGRAAALFFLATIGGPLGHARDELGNSRQGRLVERIGKHVTSKVVTVRDDPTRSEWLGQPLLGHFVIDDDSVKPIPITLIEKGILRTTYMSRVPTRLIKQTNGHSRNGEGAPGNMFVETDTPQTKEALQKRGLELAKDEDLDYVLVVEDFETSGGMRQNRGSEASLPTPSVVWRLYADGRKELVRGLSFKPMSFRALKEIDVLGDDPTLVNLELHGQRTSAVAPSVLVKSMELQKINEEREKPPLTPRPALKISPRT